MRAALRALANLLRLLVAPLWLTGHWLARPKAEWVVLRLHPRLTQFRPRAAFLRRLLARAPERGGSLEELLALVDQMVRDDRIRGLLLHLPALEAGWATCQSVRDALSTLRQAGKQVVCYLPEGGANRELYIALAADRIYAVPFSAFGPLGIAANPLYMRTLLDRLGLEVEVQACGEYKSAAEPALRDTMSAPAREQLEALLWAMHNRLAEALRERRGLSEERIAALFDRGLVGAAEALESGVIDGLAYEDELGERLGLVPSASQQVEAGAQGKFAASVPYVRVRTARLWKPVRDRPHIAVVPLRGTIAGDHGGVLRSSVRHAQLAPTLRALAANKRAAAVVLYIDSPGGSALASELIHREVARLARKKPVVAYFGDVAASGGYYIGCACRRIVAQPLTITGSIGVVSAKVAAGTLLDRLGVRPQRVYTAEAADMLSFARAMSAKEQAIMQAHATELYGRFVAVVAEGRQRPAAEIEPLARGRVWTGADAHARGLVDVLGGLDRAVDEARSMLEGVSSAERAAMLPRLYLVKTNAAQTVPDLGLAALAGLIGGLPELELLDASQREPALYYAPVAARL
jgi:protease-4